MDRPSILVEKHPLEPFIPKDAAILMLGSFPPSRKRWSMDFFYPNWINDMWRILGLAFFDDREYFIAVGPDGAKSRRFDKERCAGFAEDKGIAMYDTACEVRRLKDNASDKYLEVVKATDLEALLQLIPNCRAIAATGQKAVDVIVEKFGCSKPALGSFSELSIQERMIRLWRMPSSSRAYPLAIEKKVLYYKNMFNFEGLR